MSRVGEGQWIRPTAGGMGAGLGPMSGAKVHATTHLTQLADLGYAWDATDYDTDNYVVTAGAGASGFFDAAAVVFAIPTLAVYRVTAQAYLNTTNGNSYAVRPAMHLQTMGSIYQNGTNHAAVWYVPAPIDKHEVASAEITWEGLLDPAVDQIIGLFTLVNSSGTTDRILAGYSWMSIHRLGTVP